MSGGNDHAAKHERVLLPKLWDIIADTVFLHFMLKAGESVDFAICDVRDVFFMLPLLPQERAYFSTFFDGSFYVWRRVVQGSVNGPNVFGRLSALTGRMTQSLVDPSEARMHI